MKGVKQEDLDGGLGNRFNFVPGVPKPRRAETPPPREPAWSAVRSSLKDMVNFWMGRGASSFEFTPAALSMWKAYYEEEIPQRLGKHPKIEPLGHRLHHHCLKYALINAALDRTCRMDVCHLAPATLFANFLIDSLYYIFSDFGLSERVRTERRIVDVVRKSGPLGTKKRTLQQTMCGTRGMSTGNFQAMMKSLTASDSFLEEVQRGRSIWIVPAKG
jgi:hypothetical protein